MAYGAILYKVATGSNNTVQVAAQIIVSKVGLGMGGAKLPCGFRAKTRRAALICIIIDGSLLYAGLPKIVDGRIYMPRILIQVRHAMSNEWKPTSRDFWFPG
jgi:hypothetical protein